MIPYSEVFLRSRDLICVRKLDEVASTISQVSEHLNRHEGVHMRSRNFDRCCKANTFAEASVL